MATIIQGYSHQNPVITQQTINSTNSNTPTVVNNNTGSNSIPYTYNLNPGYMTVNYYDDVTKKSWTEMYPHTVLTHRVIVTKLGTSSSTTYSLDLRSGMQSISITLPEPNVVYKFEHIVEVHSPQDGWKHTASKVAYGLLNYYPKVSLISLNGASSNPVLTTNTTPTFTWSFTDSDGNTQSKYRLKIMDASNNSVVVDTGIVNSSSTSYTPSSPLAKKNYYWVVEVWDLYSSTTSERGYFSVGSPPSISLRSIEIISGSIARPTAEITNAEGVLTEYGFCYNTSPNPTISNSNVAGRMVGSVGMNFDALLRSLTPGTTYYVRAYAKNEVAIGYSNEMTVTPFISSDASQDKKMTLHRSGTSIGGRIREGMPAIMNGLKAYASFDGDTMIGAPPSEGLVFHVPFKDGRIKDIINGIQPTGTANISTTYGPVHDKSFDCSSGNLNYGNPEAIKQAFIGKEITIAFWWRQRDCLTPWKDVLTKGSHRVEHGADNNGGGSNGPGYWTGLYDQYGTLYSLYCDTLSGISKGEWFHFVLRKNMNEMSVWINGVKNNSVSGNFIMGYYDNDNLILGLEVVQDDMQEVRIYNRAITDEEIILLSNYRKPQLESNVLSVSEGLYVNAATTNLINTTIGAKGITVNNNHTWGGFSQTNAYIMMSTPLGDQKVAHTRWTYSGSGGGGVCFGTTDMLYVSSNTTYTFSFYLKLDTSYHHPNFIYLREYDSSKNQLSERGISSIVNRIDCGNGWYRYFATFTTSANTAFVVINQYGYDQQTTNAYFFGGQLEASLHVTHFKEYGSSPSASDFIISANGQHRDFTFFYRFIPLMNWATYFTTWYGKRMLEISDANTGKKIWWEDWHGGGTRTDSDPWIGHDEFVTNTYPVWHWHSHKLKVVPGQKEVWFALTKQGATWTRYVMSEAGYDKDSFAHTDQALIDFKMNYVRFHSDFGQLIKEVGIYNRALSEEEILRLAGTKASIRKDANLSVIKLKEEEDYVHKYSNGYLHLDGGFTGSWQKYLQSNVAVEVSTTTYSPKTKYSVFIKRPPNLTYPDCGNTVWGGLRYIVPEECKKPGKWKLSFWYRGHCSPNPMEVYFAYEIGWSTMGVGLTTPASTSIPAFSTDEWKYFELIYDLTPSIIYQTGTDGNVYDCMRQLKIGFGYNSTDSIGTRVFIDQIKITPVIEKPGAKRYGMYATEIKEERHLRHTIYLQGTSYLDGGVNTDGNAIIRVDGVDIHNGGGRGLTLAKFNDSMQLTMKCTYDTYGDDMAQVRLAQELAKTEESTYWALVSHDAHNSGTVLNNQMAAMGSRIFSSISGYRCTYAAFGKGQTILYEDGSASAANDKHRAVISRRF